MQENLLSTEQIAAYLGIDKFTVYRLVTQKKLPAFKVGNQWRYRKSMIDAWLDAQMNVRKSANPE